MGKHMAKGGHKVKAGASMPPGGSKKGVAQNSPVVKKGY